MLNSLKTALAILVLAGLGCSGTPHRLYVSPTGDDTNPGTAKKPFATIAHARDAARALKATGGYPDDRIGINVVIAGGTYRLTEPLVFGPTDSRVAYTAAEGERVIVSGGRPITGWVNEGGNRWTVLLPEVRDGSWFFRQLFAGDKRLTRARTPNEGYFLTDGALSKFDALAKNRWGGFNNVGPLRSTAPDAFCGFRYNPADLPDIADWPDWRSAEIITYHSWECSWQTIRAIDAKKHDLNMNTPCRYPVGFFSPYARYRIENVAAALDAPGEWFLNRETGVLTYLARPGENPNDMAIVAPVLERLMEVHGDSSGEKARIIFFDGISFRHSCYPMGIYDVAPDWPAPARAVYPDRPETFPPGYTDSQASPRCGQAIDLRDAENIVFVRCEMAQFGASAIHIGERCTRVMVVESELHDLGGGGVYIGEDIREVGDAGVARENMPYHNAISYNKIHDISIIHPSAVAVWIAQSHHNRIAHNEIYNTGYSGISMGWTWSRSPNYSDNNVLQANNIHDCMQQLADGGGIYTLGIQDSSVIRENYIHDIGRAEGAIGSYNNGIFFDESTKNIHVARNVIERTSHTAVRFNRNTPDEQTWEDNWFEGQADSTFAAANTLEDIRRSVIEGAGPQEGKTE